MLYVPPGSASNTKSMVPVFLQTLGKRNPALFYFGWVCLAASLVTGVCFLLDAPGSVWIRPTRFLFSTTIFVWTIAWLLDTLHEQKKLMLFNLAMILILLFENGYTVVFAIHESSTHNHISPELDAWMIRMMELGVGIISLWTAYFTWLFFTRPLPDIKRHYLWGIRFGLLFFVVFSLSGNLMAVLPGWNVASPDGGSGLPFVNWKQQSAGLRAAHFLGIHALQVLPLMGYYISRRSIITIIFSVVYFLAVLAVLMQALLQQPLIELYMG